MKIAKSIALAGLIAMTVVLVYGFTVGNFSADGAKLLANPWGIVSLVDLYVGFILFSCWIVFREKSLLRSIIRVTLMMVLGFWVGALYSLLPCIAVEMIGNVSGLETMHFLAITFLNLRLFKTYRLFAHDPSESHKSNLVGYEIDSCEQFRLIFVIEAAQIDGVASKFKSNLYTFTIS